VDERLLRYYEKRGLLRPTRIQNGYREYDEADVAVVRRIRGLLAAGLSTDTIAEIQFCIREEDPPAPACAGVIARLRDERARIDEAIARLQASRARLDDVIERGTSQAQPQGPGQRSSTRPFARKARSSERRWA
jgi:DNA-binding transcriptional MerR regulator